MKSIKKWSFTQVMVFGFLALILVGACILMLPICNANGKWLNFPDALFTSCSYESQTHHSGTRDAAKLF